MDRGNERFEQAVFEAKQRDAGTEVLDARPRDSVERHLGIVDDIGIILNGLSTCIA